MRTLELAQQLRREHGSGPEATPRLIQAVMDRLRTGGYVYTLEPGVYGQHTADEFWFDRRQGFCEHIASSFVILMRALDIPARIVTGYQGGELNGVDGYWTVRQRDAHAWTEVWHQGRGWVRVDPTSAVAPGRTGSLQRLSAPEGAVAGAIRNFSPNLAAQLRAAWEAVNNSWNQWVLNYTQGRQLDLLKNLGFKSPSWTDLAYVLIGVVVFVSLLGAAWTLWERQQHDPWLRLQHRARARLKALGLDSADHTPPRELAHRVQQRWGAAGAAQRVAQWLLKLEAQRYSRPGAANTPSLATLQHEFRQLAWPRKDSR
jgi:transglutaminase-like putative cysteine protease